MTTQNQLAWGPDPAAEINRRILAVLQRGAAAGLEEWQLELLRTLAAHKGREHAVSIAQLRRVLGPASIPEGYDFEAPHTARAIKAAVKELVERFGIPIGSARAAPWGYFLIISAEDQADAVRPLVGELRSLARRIRALSGKRELARLWGQLQLELEKEADSGIADSRNPEAA